MIHDYNCDIVRDKMYWESNYLDGTKNDQDWQQHNDTNQNSFGTYR